MSLNRILITGGAGFVGSHAASFYSKQGVEVLALDNISRFDLLDKKAFTQDHNTKFLESLPNVQVYRQDILDLESLTKLVSDCDAVIHTAAQTAVTASIRDPITDFKTNAEGTLNILEAVRRSKSDCKIIYCSTNKVYGSNVDKINLTEEEKRYSFPNDFVGIPETFSVDLCEHSPYGCSKLAGDLYVQDYGTTYGLKTCVFRMSCIYGTRQVGVEDQAWISWFTIANIKNKPFTIFGDGKQVRDVLYVDDLIRAYDKFLNGSSSLSGEVFNMGGGRDRTLSLLELLDFLKRKTGKSAQLSYADWRTGDQKVYISDIRKAKELLGWEPEVTVESGLNLLLEWIKENQAVIP